MKNIDRFCAGFLRYSNWWQKIKAAEKTQFSGFFCWKWFAKLCFCHCSHTKTVDRTVPIFKCKLRLLLSINFGISGIEFRKRRRKNPMSLFSEMKPPDKSWLWYEKQLSQKKSLWLKLHNCKSAEDLGVTSGYSIKLTKNFGTPGWVRFSKIFTIRAQRKKFYWWSNQSSIQVIKMIKVISYDLLQWRGKLRV